MSIPQQQIRACFEAQCIVVYQAYNDAIADPALAAQRFVPPFSVNRITWVKPSPTTPASEGSCAPGVR